MLLPHSRCSLVWDSGSFIISQLLSFLNVYLVYHCQSVQQLTALCAASTVKPNVNPSLPDIVEQHVLRIAVLCLLITACAQVIIFGCMFPVPLLQNDSVCLHTRSSLSNNPPQYGDAAKMTPIKIRSQRWMQCGNSCVDRKTSTFAVQ